MNTSFFFNFLPFSIHDNVPHFCVFFGFQSHRGTYVLWDIPFFIVCIFQPTTQTPTSLAIQYYLSSGVGKEPRRYEHLIFIFLAFSIHGHVPHFLVLLVCKTIEAQ